jgi:hypothetical protein
MRRFAGVALLACIITAAPAVSETAAPTALGLKLYADELDPTAFTRVNYGYDRDAVCAEGRCANGTTVCKTHLACAGIGDGLCDLNRSCTGDFSPNCAPPNDICGVAVDSLAAGAPAGQSIWELVCDPATPGGNDCQVGFSLPATTVSWDFSGVNLTSFPDLAGMAATTAPITGNEFENPTNASACGFSEAGAQLDRQDKGWQVPADAVPTLNSIERENGVQVCMNGSAATNGKICTSSGDCGGGGTCETTATIWLRAAIRYEGVTGGGLGEGESRICHVSGGRTEVPLWRFPNQDSSGQYMQFGDPRWEHTAFACENTILAPTAVNVQACSGFEGKQFSEVVNEGVIELPSGHKFKSLVVRSTTEYCVYILGCLVNVDSVRTVNHLWEVPHLGTVVRLQSDKTAPNLTDFIHLSEIDVKYGLYPPLSLGVGSIGESSVQLSWDPGAITDHISGYRIYWDTESGGRCNIGGEDCNSDYPGSGNCPAGKTCCGTAGDTCDGYDFDSVTDSGDVNWDSATSATVAGLDPNTTYHFTVTATSDYTDPGSLDTTTYESVLYPTQVPAVPVDLPIEVSATTAGGCSPSVEVGALSAGKTGTDVDLCWDAAADPCIDGYRILGASTPESAGNFTTEADTGPVTCEAINPSGSFFLVVGRGSSGTGPWGHFGQ